MYTINIMVKKKRDVEIDCIFDDVPYCHFRTAGKGVEFFNLFGFQHKRSHILESFSVVHIRHSIDENTKKTRGISSIIFLYVHLLLHN